MKRVVSVSLGSSSRNHAVETEILGEKFLIERIGTDGDKKKAIALIKELDGKVDAFGMGGIDIYLTSGSRRYVLRDALPIRAAAKITPMVDGSGLKNTLERRAIYYLRDQYHMPLAGKKVLIVAAIDRFGMAESFADIGCELIIGDIIFALGLPIPLKSLKALDRVARILGPVICQLPFEMLYPTGKDQQKIIPKFTRFYNEADIIAGDFLFIKRHMPERLDGKIIVTNTVTQEDVAMLKERGVKILVTTTPNLSGRSFGTNVMEAVLVALAGKPADQITPEDYTNLLDRIGFVPRIEEFDKQEVAV